MDLTHLHLVINHFPIFSILIGMFVLVYGTLRKERAVIRAAMWIFILGSLSVFPVLQTGEAAEETVEHLQGIDEHYIHEHEEMAEWSGYVVGLLGLVAVIGLFAGAKQWGRHIWLLALAVGSVCVVFFIRLGNLGGEIRHTEIRATENPAIHTDRPMPAHELEEAHEDDD